jgi:diphosphate-dependent phosphofructokinase
MEDVVSERSDVNVQVLLVNPEIQEIVSPTSQVMQARRAYKPSICNVLQREATVLKTNGDYRFEVDPEAKKELPKIIGNRVQVVAPGKRTEAYAKPQKIGIVFSGGPAPGGHNVIAGLYDAAKKANPDSEIYGFLVGPDGIIESEYVQLNDELVGNYRNLGGFTMIKTGRTKIDTPEKMALSR